MRDKLTCLGLMASLALMAPLPAAAQQSDVALVYKLLLDANAIVTPVSATEHVAALGERLKNGDVVRTSSNTRAAIRFTDDGSILRLNPSSRLQIRAEGERNAVVKTLELEFGELWAKVNRRDGAQFRVQTPGGVAAVKGTEFIVRVDADGNTSIITIEGMVEFFNRGGTTEVGAGRKTVVANADQAPVAEAASEQDVEQFEGLIDEEVSDSNGGNNGVDIEVQLQDADGAVRTVILRVPRRALRGLLEGGR